MSENLVFTSDVEAATIEVAVRGRWNQGLWLELSGALRKCLAERPCAILLDLAGLDDPTGQSVAALLSADRMADGVEPRVRLLVCGPPSGVARRLRATGLIRTLTVFPTLAEARAAALSGLPTRLRRRAEYSADYLSTALARDLVGSVCAEWRVPQLLHRARAVVSELATNAVEHAGTPFVLTVSLRGNLLHLAVKDGSALPPRLLDPQPYDPGRPRADLGRGLRVVSEQVTSWGTRPCRGGKVVWAVLRAWPASAG